MHVHILGICGTFMAGLAILARQLGHEVTGSDANVYPPMSDQLSAQGITLLQGYNPDHLKKPPDHIVIGNVLTRGNPMVEYILDHDLPYTSGPQWLAEHVLRDRWVIAVAGTHGKTTVTSMIAWILESAGLSPGFLVGGIPENFGVSARIGDAPFFVLEADEYDTAFFDKRSKFIHYRPRTVVLNNIEYDHADIFPDLDAIMRQFHHLIRVVPGNGLIVRAARDANISEILSMGCWTPVKKFGEKDANWRATLRSGDGSAFEVRGEGAKGDVDWSLLGQHNVDNALAAIAASHDAGVPVDEATIALGGFRNVKRRMEERANINNIIVYDDFAHHPTAIAASLGGLRARVGSARILAVLELRSNTMRMGVHRAELGAALRCADLVWVHRAPDIAWSIEQLIEGFGSNGHAISDIDAIVEGVAECARPSDHILIMSNAAFGGIHEKLIEALKKKYD